MGYAVELHFDPDCEARIRGLWARLAAARLGDDLDALGFVPHLTLSVSEALELEPARDFLASWARQHLPLPITFSAIGLFPGEILFLVPVVTAPLLAAHRQVHQQMLSLAQGRSPLYAPSAWTPHCTLTMNLRQDERPLALQAILQGLRLPITGELREAHISSYRPEASRIRQLLS